VSVVVAAGYTIGLLLQLSFFWWSALPFVLLLVASIAEFVLGDYLAEQTYPIETERKLELLERQLGTRAIETIEDKLRRIIASFRACDTSRVSGTVHIVISLTPSPEEPLRFGLLQLTNYVGPLGGRKGRVVPLENGIVGRCARTTKTEVVNFATLEEYQRRMVAEFGFSWSQVAEHTSVARSYLAEPLLVDSKKLIGVLYFFSSEPQVFPHAARESNLPNSALDLVDLLKTVAII
jgi:hypothetical protein